MIEGLVPAGVTVVTGTALELDDEQLVAALWPAEAELVAGASANRRAEFAAVRGCAREALRRMGLEPGPVLKGGRGMPLFPAGVVGTLTHTAGYRAAALAPARELRAVGADVERHKALPDKVLPTVSLPEERAWVEAAALVEPDIHWDALLFTAKEATYKVWYPLTRRWLGFADARITFSTDLTTDSASASTAVATGTWRSEILVDPAAVDGGPDVTVITGRWQIAGGYVASVGTAPVGPDTSTDPANGSAP